MKLILFLTVFITSFNVWAEDSLKCDLKIYCSKDKNEVKSCNILSHSLNFEYKNELFYIDTYHGHAPRFLLSIQIDDHEALSGFSYLNAPNREAIRQMKTGKNVKITTDDALLGRNISIVSLLGLNEDLNNLVECYHQFSSLDVS